MEFYDSPLIGIGYHPFSDTYVFTEEYKQSVENNHFMIKYKELDNDGKIDKLKQRINNWYNAEYTVEEHKNYNFNLMDYNYAIIEHEFGKNKYNYYPSTYM